MIWILLAWWGVGVCGMALVWTREADLTLSDLVPTVIAGVAGPLIFLALLRGDRVILRKRD